MRLIVTQSLAYLLILAGCKSTESPKPFEYENSSKEVLADQLIVLKRAALEEQNRPYCRRKVYNHKKITRRSNGYTVR
jgi:hypothetical protein